MVFVFDDELGIKLSVRIQKRKDKHSSMRWLQIEDGDWGGTAETKHEMRAECWLPDWSLVIHSRVIVTDHRALQSGVCVVSGNFHHHRDQQSPAHLHPSQSGTLHSHPTSNTWLTAETRERLKVGACFLLSCENVSCFHYCQGQLGSSCPSHLFMFIRAS